MLELIALLAALALCIWVPIEARKVRGGWMRKRFEGTHADFVVKYRRELTMIAWVGLGLGVLNLALAFVLWEGGAHVKIIAGVTWLAAGAIAWTMRRQLEPSPGA